MESSDEGDTRGLKPHLNYPRGIQVVKEGPENNVAVVAAVVGCKVWKSGSEPFGFIGATDARKPTVRLDLRA